MTEGPRAIVQARERRMDTSPIVAVASSADDLEAVSELLSALPAECSVTFIVVQRLNAGRERLLAEALAKRTIRPVMYARDGVVAEQDHVYLIPANTTLTMSGRRIRVTPDASKLQHPGDILFASLAQERGDSAIGVVLSGGGSDGALGIRAIRQGGGTTFAQYPGSARFTSMPISAIETGCVGFVLRPNEIARELTRLSRHAAPLAGVAGSVLVSTTKRDSAEAMALQGRS
jgi:two-component system, chemotaxis family, CheB/CheR fusion protein